MSCYLKTYTIDVLPVMNDQIWINCPVCRKHLITKFYSDETPNINSRVIHSCENGCYQNSRVIHSCENGCYQDDDLEEKIGTYTFKTKRGFEKENHEEFDKQMRYRIDNYVKAIRLARMKLKFRCDPNMPDEIFMDYVMEKEKDFEKEFKKVKFNWMKELSLQNPRFNLKPPIRGVQK